MNIHIGIKIKFQSSIDSNERLIYSFMVLMFFSVGGPTVILRIIMHRYHKSIAALYLPMFL